MDGNGITLRLVCFLYGSMMTFIGGVGLGIAKEPVISGAIAFVGFLLLYVATFAGRGRQATTPEGGAA